MNWLATLPAQASVLFEHQREQLTRIVEAIKRVRRPLVQAPTGAGKTHLIGVLTAAAKAAGLRTLILATRTRLVRQTHERLDAFGIPHGVLAAALPELRNHNALVQVASVDTLYRRLIDQRAPLPAADVVLFDEAHLSTGPSRAAILERYPNAWRIGFTATPAKVSGRSLAAQFDEIIPGPSVRELIALGKLVRPRVFNQPVVSTSELQAVGRDSKTNDFTNAGLSTLMMRPKLVGDVVQNWLKIANGKRTLCFAVNKQHGEQLVLEFRRAGIAAELLTDQTPEDEREAAIARLEAGQTLLLVSCFLLSYGVDIPSIEAISIARPTRSLILYLQTVGRGLRPFPGKEHCIIIDHGRVIETLGLPHEDFGWTLDPTKNVSSAAIAAHGRMQTAEQPRTCPECSHMWLTSEEGSACGECGWIPQPKAKGVGATAADLAELDVSPDEVTPLSPAALQFVREVIGEYRRLWPDRWRATPSKARAFAFMKAREKFRWPESTAIPRSYWSEQPTPPSKETSGWLLSRRIAYGKARSARIFASMPRPIAPVVAISTSA
jgi:superfamily II DNA or RNA helicase